MRDLCPSGDREKYKGPIEELAWEVHGNQLYILRFPLGACEPPSCIFFSLAMADSISSAGSAGKEKYGDLCPADHEAGSFPEGPSR